MQELLWLESHIGSIEEGIEVINKLYWNIVVGKSEEKWFVYAGGGEKTLFVADSREAVDAFLYGFALAYSVLPEHAFENLQKEIRSFTE